MFDDKSLAISEVHEFSGTVVDGQNTFAAKLHLSPEKITLSIMGEQNEQRHCELGWGNIENLIFRDGNKTFLLHELRFTSGRDRVISRHPEAISFFESVFEVAYVIYSHLPLGKGDLVKSINIQSNKISKWIGNTNKQEKIIEAFINKEEMFDSPDKLIELRTQLEGIGDLCIGYNLEMHHSSPDFSAGIRFPPSITILFLYDQPTDEVMKRFLGLYDLLAFFIGNDFFIEQIDIFFESGPFGKEGSLYYPSIATNPKYERDYSLFPLGRDIRFDTLGLPSLPIDSFNKYYLLNEVTRSYFSKYLKYKRMENSEERFLGYFRLLESLCFKKKSYLDEELLKDVCAIAKPWMRKKFGDRRSVDSFLSGILRYNNSKYNTAKCIQDFYLKIPKNISSKWKIKKSDISDICELRNDITHANDYYISPTELAEKEKFIEVLLNYSLFEKLGVELSLAGIVMPRLSGYHLITKTV